ncbi:MULTISPECIES: LacI family DNA-binding transcriptional regulator [Paenibacillus]|uniref:LacI family DNA-binding transcriptional regulator n=1 Tax=Paenibacillus TaxID=44249 RepID=UPI0022B8A4B8|nr:LacI family DNA-binding transcriptional regulator [Paenibacillus caseinilyticus]MCZ8518542.1 LacI family DNA-binding transcriptional regulator [Paenibacillus caseinilyticus]
MKATIYDVAREAGVSIATVSNAIRGKGKISPQKREEILEIARQLQYQPSMIASALTGKKTYTLGLLVPDISNPFFGEIARAVEERGRQLGYSVIICSTDNKDERLERYLSLLQQKSVDGIIIGTGITDASLLEGLSKRMVPTVLVARDLPSADVHKVIIDDYGGGAMAARHLLELGHRRLAVISEKHNRERVRGFCETVRESGQALSDCFIRICGDDNQIEDGRRAADELMGLPERPTALFCCNDLSATGALRSVKTRGLAVPGDISIVSFDNTILSEVCDPPLTAIAQPMEDMGRLVVDALLQELGAGAERQRIVLHPELIVRGSTSVCCEAQRHV